MATDKRLDQVSQLTDFDYALIVKGDQVAKVSKQQLAELVGDLLYGATNASSLATVVAGLLYKGNINNVDLDTLIDFGTYYFNNGCTNQPDKVENGCLVVIKSTSGRCVQLAFRAESYQFAFRMQWNDFSQEGNPVFWGKWVYLALESL